MANELVINYTTGLTLYALLFNSTGQVWNGAAFEACQAANWTDYDIAMTEVATTGVYLGAMPAVAAGAYAFAVRRQAGAAPAVGDVTAGAGEIMWTGTAEDSTTNSALATLIGTVDTVVDAILVDTGTDIPASIAALPTDVDVQTAAAAAILVTPANKLDTDASGHVSISGTKNTLDDLATAIQGADGDTLETLSDQLDAIPWNAAWDAEVQSEVADALNAYDPPTATEMTNALNALNDITVADIIAGISEGSLDLQEMLRIMLAALAGKASGGGTTTIKFRDQADTLDRITATVDANGNRSAVVVDGS